MELGLRSQFFNRSFFLKYKEMIYIIFFLIHNKFTIYSLKDKQLEIVIFIMDT